MKELIPKFVIITSDKKPNINNGFTASVQGKNSRSVMVCLDINGKLYFLKRLSYFNSTIDLSSERQTFDLFFDGTDMNLTIKTVSHNEFKQIRNGLEEGIFKRTFKSIQRYLNKDYR